MLSMCRGFCHIQIIRFLEIADHSRSNNHSNHINPLALFIYLHINVFATHFIHIVWLSVESSFPFELFIFYLHLIIGTEKFANYLIKDTNALERRKMVRFYRDNQCQCEWIFTFFQNTFDFYFFYFQNILILDYTNSELVFISIFVFSWWEHSHLIVYD